jgi:hypothetical protein
VNGLLIDEVSPLSGPGWLSREWLELIFEK